MDHRAVRIVAQSSYIAGAPWFVAADIPQKAGCRVPQSLP
jgi:hypothetical protein